LYTFEYMKLLLFGLIILCFHSSFTQKNKLYSCLAKGHKLHLAYFFSLGSFCYFNLDKTIESLDDISIVIKMNQENASNNFMRSLMRYILGDIKGYFQDLKKSSELGNITAVEYLNIYCEK
ncbi:MAG: hypothetical protein ACKO1R_03065, partial [Crocinitomicaceae bacterium]